MEPNNHNGKLRVVDRWGHTLCYFNGQTKDIEIKVMARRGGQQSTKGEVYAINIEDLLSAFQDAQSTPEPILLFIARIKELQSESAGA